MRIPEGFSQVNLIFNGPGVPTGAEMTFGIDNSVALSPADIADNVGTIYVAAGILAVINNDVDLAAIRVKNGPNDDGPFAVVPNPVASTLGGDSAPPNTAVLIRKFTAAGGRRGSGRFYMPGPNEGSIGDGGLLTSTYIDDVQDAWAAFALGLATADLPMVLLHDNNREPDLVTSLEVQATAATQRRRLRR